MEQRRKQTKEIKWKENYRSKWVDGETRVVLLAFVCACVCARRAHSAHFGQISISFIAYCSLFIVSHHTQFPFSFTVDSIFEHIFSVLIFNLLFFARLPHSCCEQTSISLLDRRRGRLSSEIAIDVSHWRCFCNIRLLVVVHSRTTDDFTYTFQLIECITCRFSLATSRSNVHSMINHTFG